MSTITTTRSLLSQGVAYAWGPMANGDAGEAVEATEYGDRSVQVTGTFGTGGTVLIEGSNDGTNWATLADPQGNALSFTATKIEQVLEAVRYIRPRVSAGDGTTSLTATLYARRSIR